MSHNATEIASLVAQLNLNLPTDQLDPSLNPGKAFRETTELIINLLAKQTLAGLPSVKPKLLTLWHSGIAFAEPYRALGVGAQFQLSTFQTEKTLDLRVDYTDMAFSPADWVIIADTTLATGHTLADAVSRVQAQGVPENQIIVNAILAAPEGIEYLKNRFPALQIQLGVLESGLDSAGALTPDSANFGQRYFAGLDQKGLVEFLQPLRLSAEAETKLIQRVSQIGITEVLTALLARDQKDEQIATQNRDQLQAAGLKLHPPQKTLQVDNGGDEGIAVVVERLVEQIKLATLDHPAQVLGIEGLSGTGKGAITTALAHVLKAPVFSMGEIFRYLTYLSMQAEAASVHQILGRMHYEVHEGVLQLFDQATPVSALGAALRAQALESLIPSMAKGTQKEVIEFSGAELTRLTQGDPGLQVLVEGRGFTLDFLPCDLRIVLFADPMIRAKRRWAQA